jgi:hypothetical protein
MTFRSAASLTPSAFVPTRLLVAPRRMNTPWLALPSRAVPAALVPM